ncbi:MAG: hypothetical protein K0U29_04475 [Gammaproteobacteria bacterium]|nr:hypothetical protein [Gammaproteobacteria bacterium]
MKEWKTLLAALVVLILSDSAIAAPNDSQFNPGQSGASHVGGFVSGNLGVNVVKVQLGSKSTRGAGITGQLELGYNFTPAIAIVGGGGYYFSGIALGMHAGVRGFLPVSHRINLTGDLGAAYLTTFSNYSAAGPYVGIGSAFSMSQQTDINIMLNDIILSKAGATGNIISLLFGLTYHF